MKPVRDILKYIPQRHPMIMIDEIVDVGKSGITTKFLIDKGNIFCHNGIFREPGIIENIAQTAAARVGFICERENREVPLGFIGSVKDLVIHQLPVAGDILKTDVTIEHEVFNATIIHGKIYCRDNILAQCEMKIFIQKGTRV